MTQETKHLLYWWAEWLVRLLRTTYHIFNRTAYREWKNNKYKKTFHGGMLLEDDLH